ncbi:MAG: NAD(P)H-dependent glycerol-3-phosphate dehydrogenase [Deltaproteobacteria bacterium]
MRASVIGAGSWGTALALVLARKGFPVKLWVHDAAKAKAMAAAGENAVYLPGFPLPTSLVVTASLEEALRETELVVEVVPSHAVRDVMGRAAPLLRPGVPIVTASKGIENGTLLTMTEVLEDVLPPLLHPYLCVLSGPSFAREVGHELPTAVSVASRWERIAREVQQAFAAPHFRVYTCLDVVGVELGGALKNVIAIGAGVCEGLGFGQNSRAALITRGLSEITRLAVKKGANPITLSGLAGMGDLVLTCTGQLSRNRAVGLELGKGRKLDEIVGEMKMVAEGVKNARSTHDLGKKLEVDLPICETVYRLLYEGIAPRDAVVALLGREAKAEFV